MFGIDRLNLKFLCDVIDFSNYTIYILGFQGLVRLWRPALPLGRAGLRDGRWSGGGGWPGGGGRRRQLEVAQGGWQRFRADGKAYLVESGRR